ncbi:MAG: penicillin acylase family protein, partial [Actinomycetota bacterium]|nr:penicillin acylase family protein [Actinomycetota bacterium]
MRRLLTLAMSVLLTAAVAVAAPAAEADNEVTIVRDSYGVPHLFADTEEALFHGLGYASAQDRLWQGELLRRQGTGTLAELIGPDGVASDIQARLLFGPPERRAALIEAAPDDVVAVLEAYISGINAWIEEATATGQLPVEFAAAGFTPRPWTLDDSVATFMAVGSQFGWSGADELTTAGIYAGLIAALGPETAAAVFADTHWLDDPSAPTTSPDPSPTPASVAAAPAAPSPDAVAAATVVDADRVAAQRGRERAGLHGEGNASNAAVLAPELTADGAPLLLGGPQMGYTAPQINHEVGLHGAGFDITGMTIIGFPLVPIGVGDGYAWTLTSGGTDNTDIFAEVIDPNDPSHYLFDGASLPFDCRVEVILVAGADPVSETLCATVHGPVLAVVGETAYSLQSVTFGEEIPSLGAWLRLGATDDLAGFSAQLGDIAYNFNVLYADDDGNIAYWHIGHIPIRADGVDPRFPTPGTGEAEWQGTIPFAAMPHSLNPEQGWLASWNNKPAPGWANSSANFWRWGP